MGASSFRKHSVMLTGEDLAVEDAVLLGKLNTKILVSHKSMEKVQKGRQVVDDVIAKNEPVYGINTGFGVHSDKTISPQDLKILQENLLKSHATGSGKILPVNYARTMVALRINTLLRGNSGIAPETLNRIVAIFNKNLVPQIYTHGSVGASGDLAPLANIAASYLIGEGQLYDPETNKFEDAKLVLRRHGFDVVHDLKAKEGLAMINGTQYITSVGSHAFVKAKQAFNAARVATALSLVGIEGHRAAFEPFVYNTRNQEGAKEEAQIIYGLTAPSIKTTKLDQQDPYSFRCVPQVHGTARSCFDAAQKALECELNSSTDNPVVYKGQVKSGGNFHGQPVARSLDILAMGVRDLISMSAQRIQQLLIGKRGLPTFLSGANPGLNSGFMTLEIESAAHDVVNVIPYSTKSRPTGLGKEDHVSMGAHCARQVDKLVQEHLFPTIATELAAATQAIRIRQKQDVNFKIPEKLKAIFNELDKLFPFLEDDRYLNPQIKAIEQFARTSPLFATAVEFAQKSQISENLTKLAM